MLLGRYMEHASFLDVLNVHGSSEADTTSAQRRLLTPSVMESEKDANRRSVLPIGASELIGSISNEN